MFRATGAHWQPSQSNANRSSEWQFRLLLWVVKRKFYEASLAIFTEVWRVNHKRPSNINFPFAVEIDKKVDIHFVRLIICYFDGGARSESLLFFMGSTRSIDYTLHTSAVCA